MKTKNTHKNKVGQVKVLLHTGKNGKTLLFLIVHVCTCEAK